MHHRHPSSVIRRRSLVLGLSSLVLLFALAATPAAAGTEGACTKFKVDARVTAVDARLLPHIVSVGGQGYYATVVTWRAFRVDQKVTLSGRLCGRTMDHIRIAYGW